MDLKTQIKQALGLEEKEVQLEYQAKLEDGTIIVSEAEGLAEGIEIAVLTEDGTTIPLPVGTYKTEDGKTFKVEEEGKVAMVMEEEAEEEGEVEVEEEEMNEEEMKHKPDHKYEEIEERMTKLEQAIDELSAKFGENKEEMAEELAEENLDTIEEKSDSPKTVTTKTTEVVEFSAEEEIEKLKAENEKLKIELSKKPADNPINTNKFSNEKTILNRSQYNKLSKQERFLYNLNK